MISKRKRNKKKRKKESTFTCRITTHKVEAVASTTVFFFSLSHLYAFSLPAGEGFLHYAVVLAQNPVFIYQLGIDSPKGSYAVTSIFLWGLRCPLGMVNVEDHISFRHIEVPGDDRRGLFDLNQHLYRYVK